MPVWLTWTAIKALFATTRFWIVAAAVGGAVMTLGYLASDYSARGVEINALNTEVKSLEGQLAVSTANYANALETVDELNLRLQGRAGTLDALCKAYVKSHLNMDPETQECIDPVVGTALDDLKNLEDKK